MKTRTKFLLSEVDATQTEIFDDRFVVGISKSF